MRLTPKHFQRSNSGQRAAAGQLAPDAPVDSRTAPLHASRQKNPPRTAQVGVDAEIKVKFLDLPPTPIESVAPPFHIFDGRRRVISTTVALALLLIPIRGAVVGWGLASMFTALDSVPYIIMTAVYDVIFAVAIGALAYGAIWLLRWRPGAQRLACIAYEAVSLLVLLCCAANIEVVRMLGEPFNFRWLYYSDFFRGDTSRQAIMASLNPTTVIAAVWACCMLLALAFGLRFGAKHLWRRVAPRTLLVGVIPALLVTLGFSHWFLTTQQWNAQKLRNPIVAFAASLLKSYNMPALFSMTPRVGPDDVAAVADRGPTPATVAAPHDAEVKNVIVYVLESVGARYTDLYGGKHAVTPNLNRYADRAVVFDSVYSSAPATNLSLVAMVCSTFPWISYRSLTEEHPNAALDSISSVLKSRGYRTAFISSSELGFQGARNFLQPRSFDVLEDFHDRPGAAPVFKSEWWYLNGSDERTTVKSMMSWIDAGRDREPEKPFFGMLWTMQAHHPYFVTGEAKSFDGVKDAELNKYLHAIQQVDQGLGDLLDGLAQRGLLDSTLVVVVGDHGEAFGQHGQRGHATALYEENIHVPCVLINPRLFHGERRSGIGGLTDLSPTILDILRIDPPSQWQGRSLFTRDLNSRAYFAAPWVDYMFGYREGNQKLIMMPTQNRYEVYDLASDPGENKNISDRSSTFIAAAKDRLAAWVQYQDRLYSVAFKAGVNDQSNTAAATNVPSPSASTTRPVASVLDR